MALLDEVRLAVRVSDETFDAELIAHVAAAMTDLRRVGVRESLLDPASLSPLAKAAVIQWVKADFGYDNPEAARFRESYREIARSLVCSSANECDETEDAYLTMEEFTASIVAALTPTDSSTDGSTTEPSTDGSTTEPSTDGTTTEPSTDGTTTEPSTDDTTGTEEPGGTDEP